MIEGGLNFRDLGGVAVDARRRVRPGLVYRSGGLHALTDRGLDGLKALGVHAVYDLRSNQERASRPPRLPADGAIRHLFHPHDRRTGDLFATLREAGRTSNDGKAIMQRIYRALPHEFVTPYRELFLRIADGPLPIVFNCAAGKDRTGLAAALLLCALGAPREEILRDYLRSEEAFADILAMFVSGSGAALTASVDRAVWEPIVRTDADYIAVAFAVIDERYGSIAGYLRDGLGLDDGKLKALRERLIESA